MGNYKFTFFIVFAQFFGHADSGFFLVESVRMAGSVYVLKAGHARYIGKFVCIRRIDDKGGNVIVAGDTFCHSGAKHCGMLGVFAAETVVYQKIGSGIDAAFAWGATASAGRNGGNTLQRLSLLFKYLHNCLIAIFVLVGRIFKFGELIRIVRNFNIKNLCLVFK